MTRLIAFFILVAFWSCAEPNLSSSQEQYVIQAFDSIETYSIHKNTYNFDSLESVVLQKISNQSKLEELHNELEIAIKAIDRHSYITSKQKYSEMESGTYSETVNNPYPFKGKLLSEKYAYVSMNGFIGVDSTSSDNYTDSLQRLIVTLYEQNPSGWIIDLRYNHGGWPYPMIAGLGPILGKGIKAYTLNAEGPQLEYYFAINDSDYLLVSDSVYFFDKQLPVVILIGKETGSAAELLTLAFRGNPKTTLIGEPTYGVSTGLRAFIMPDSFRLAITNSIMTDRNMVGDGGPIKPMISANDATEAFKFAYEWIDQNE